MTAFHQTLDRELDTSTIKRSARKLIDILPGLAGLGIFVTWEQDDTDGIAYTNGERIVVQNEFWTLPQREQYGILAHELLHVGLAHPLRAKKLALTETSFDLHIFNIACDAVINYALANVQEIALPKSAVNLIQLEHAYQVNLQNRSAEQIYAILKTVLTPKITMLFPQSIDIALPDGNPNDIEKTEERIATWNGRLQTAIGSESAARERLYHDLPRVTTPWQSIFRSYVRRQLTSTRKPDYRRPHRRWLATSPQSLANGIVVPLTYALRRQQAPRLAFVADTSGSIDDELLARFTAEMISIVHTTHAKLLLMSADTDVHQMQEILPEHAARTLKSFIYQGGGGTNFAPAIDRAAAWNPNALVYFTDGYGYCGPEPQFPVIWAMCPNATTNSMPFGKRIDLR